MLLMKDDSSSSSNSMKDLLPLMMMGGMGGQGGAGGMDPMMMMLLMDDSSSSSGDSMKDLLPLMMMQGGMGGQGGAAGGMNPMMMMLMMDDDCKIPETFTKLSKDERKSVASGAKFYLGTTPATAVTADLKALTAVTDANNKNALKYVDYDYIKCASKGSSSMSSLLPLLMMGDDSSSMSDMLPLMMMGGGMGGAQPGQAGAMNPMMLMLLGDDEKSEAACSRKYKLDKAFLWDATAKKVVAKTTAADIRTTVKDIKANVANYGYTAVPSIITDYTKCITDAKGKVGDDSKKESSKMKDLLPLMMMGGQGGMGGMDPMMMMLMLK